MSEQTSLEIERPAQALAFVTGCRVRFWRERTWKGLRGSVCFAVLCTCPCILAIGKLDDAVDRCSMQSVMRFSAALNFVLLTLPWAGGDSAIY